jgi:hypothetical protein
MRQVRKSVKLHVRIVCDEHVVEGHPTVGMYLQLASVLGSTRPISARGDVRKARDMIRHLASGRPADRRAAAYWADRLGVSLEVS